LKKGYSILGVSADSEKKHRNFIQKFHLPFSLISDTDLTICKAYGVWGDKVLFGRKYMGIIRTTFLIDEKGKIERIIDKVESKAHAAQII
jgi:peroxiredoxin Q/BCP